MFVIPVQTGIQKNVQHILLKLLSLTMLDLKVAQAYSLVSEDNKKNCQLRKLGYNC
jgi:hypothetical protein